MKSFFIVQSSVHFCRVVSFDIIRVFQSNLFIKVKVRKLPGFTSVASSLFYPLAASGQGVEGAFAYSNDREDDYTLR